MKYLLFLIMMFCSAVHSQGGTSYYLDGKPIEISKTFLDPSNIQMDKATENDVTIGEVVYIKRLNTESEVLTIAEFARQLKRK